MKTRRFPNTSSTPRIDYNQPALIGGPYGRGPKEAAINLSYLTQAEFSLAVAINGGIQMMAVYVCEQCASIRMSVELYYALLVRQTRSQTH